jgi:hypothetical protein
MIYLRQSTASQEVILGRFLNSTDGNTQVTGLTIANTDIDIWKTGATAYVDKNSGGATHIAGGLYYCTLDATDTDTIGPMRIDVHVTGALAVTTYCTVLDEAVYDVLFGTTAPSTLAAGALMGLANDAITAAKFDESTAFPQTGDAYARLGAPAGASVSADVAAIKIDTAAILVDTGTTLDALIKDIPTIAEFEARTLVAADYTLVSDLPVAPDNASITAILEDTGTTIPATLAALPVAAKKSTALANFAFVMTDDTNHELTAGLTVTCTRSIDGGAFAAGTLANITEISAGVYNVDFGAGDLNGDVVVLRATATGADNTIVTIVTAK